MTRFMQAIRLEKAIISKEVIIIVLGIITFSIIMYSSSTHRQAQTEREIQTSLDNISLAIDSIPITEDNEDEVGLAKEGIKTIRGKVKKLNINVFKRVEL